VTPLETVAALFGVVSVYLSTRERVAAWPTALVNVALYAIIFRDQRLYADMGLQCVYFVLSLYGWYQWKFGGSDRSALLVSRAPARYLAALMGLNILAWLSLGIFLDRSTDAVLPYLDSLLTTTSLVAQYLMTRKVLQSWALWIAVDLIYVPMFVSRGLYLTAVLYALFLGLAFKGWRDWKRSLAMTAGPVPSP